MKDQKQPNAEEASRETEVATLIFIPGSTVKVNRMSEVCTAACARLRMDARSPHAHVVGPKSPLFSGSFTLFWHNIHSKNRRGGDSQLQRVVKIFPINWHLPYSPQVATFPLAQPQRSPQNRPGAQWKVTAHHTEAALCCAPSRPRQWIVSAHLVPRAQDGLSPPFSLLLFIQYRGSRC